MTWGGLLCFRAKCRRGGRQCRSRWWSSRIRGCSSIVRLFVGAMVSLMLGCCICGSIIKVRIYRLSSRLGINVRNIQLKLGHEVFSLECLIAISWLNSKLNNPHTLFYVLYAIYATYVIWNRLCLFPHCSIN